MPNCENLEYSTTCNDDGQLEFEAHNTSEEQEAEILMILPEGAEIYDSSGNLVYRVEQSHDSIKGKIRIPPGL